MFNIFEFVIFHVALGSNETVHPNQTLKHKEYLSMIQMVFASALLFYPEAKTTILTDIHSDFEGIPRRVNRVRINIDTNKLMFERANAQLRYVQENSFASPIVFLDSDILINDSLLPIFKNEFDVAVTWRANEIMPINGGFLILNNTRPEITKRFFKRYITIYQEKYADKAAWFGDQLALRDCVGLNVLKLAGQEIVDIEGCRILLLPCDTYNFSPKNRYQEICSNLSDKAVLHFKGERKRLMLPFWEAWLKPSNSYMPWVKYKGWLERRRLRRYSEIEELKFNSPRD